VADDCTLDRMEKKRKGKKKENSANPEVFRKTLILIVFGVR